MCSSFFYTFFIVYLIFLYIVGVHLCSCAIIFYSSSIHEKFTLTETPSRCRLLFKVGGVVDKSGRTPTPEGGGGLPAGHFGSSPLPEKKPFLGPLGPPPGGGGGTLTPLGWVPGGRRPPGS